MKHVFIIGSKGIPAQYGGFETFVEYLTKLKQSPAIKYHVACMSMDRNDDFEYNNARCFYVKIPNIGSAKAVLYDLLSLKSVVNYSNEHKIKDGIVYILASRIGPFMNIYKHKLRRLGFKIYLNPDGHEWKRSKWNVLIKKYWKLSERQMVKNVDLSICDSKGIEKYIQESYRKYHPVTKYISYGADIKKSPLNKDDNDLYNWFKKFYIHEKNYYLIVGRFVPENNYETMIREFIKSKTTKDLVIITNVEKNKFYDRLKEETSFTLDKRIKFVGTVYDQDLLKKIRELAFCYIHGHEVGGTNPSLLEALASTKINLLLDVVFNKEVGSDAAFYFTKDKGSLEHCIEQIENLKDDEIKIMGSRSKKRIEEHYSWSNIVNEYENIFLG